MNIFVLDFKQKGVYWSYHDFKTVFSNIYIVHFNLKKKFAP